MRLLSRLRWLAVLGQALTLLLVTGPMGLTLPPMPLWSGIAVLALFNVYATLRAAQPREASNLELFTHLAVDIAVLAWMVGWSGGIENPFISLFLLPIALAILALPGPWAWATAVCALLGFGMAVLLGRPLPHMHSAMGDTFGLHKAGMLVNFLLSATVLLLFFTRLASLWRAREQDLATLRERFARNEGIVALATHAASVAHELNTPLNTLTLLVDEMAAAPDHKLADEDVGNLRMLIGQCRDRVRALAAPAQHGGASTRVSLEEVIDRWRLVRPTVRLERSGSTAGDEHVDAAVGHLLQALLDNAADAGAQSGVSRVDLRLQVRDAELSGEIRDYGPGFGEATPVLPGTLFRTSKPQGLGIGLALSHATVERLGGELSMEATEQGGGVRVSFRLPAVIA